MTEVPTQRRKAPEQRRRDIIDAASRLLHERGFDATTVQHIAEAAGVAAGTVYLYFPSKEHVLQAMHDEFHAGLLERLRAVTADAVAAAGTQGYDYGAGIEAMVDGVVAFLLERVRDATVILRYLPRVSDDALHDVDETAAVVADALRAGNELGHIEVADPEMTGRLLTAALRETLLHAVVEGRADDIPRLAVAAKALFRKALAPGDPA